MLRTLTALLAPHNLAQYVAQLEAEGTTIDDISDLAEDEDLSEMLQDAFGITKFMHRRKMIKVFKEYAKAAAQAAPAPGASLAAPAAGVRQCFTSTSR